MLNAKCCINLKKRKNEEDETSTADFSKTSHGLSLLDEERRAIKDVNHEPPSLHVDTRQRGISQGTRRVTSHASNHPKHGLAIVLHF